ncbi:taurine catabolism dioxygenase TauD, TfdA family protein [Xenorhabdus stockiae]|uniref:Taurine catabolism dioxygenase TauD, TfdA family protein n=1 Tax=Xenorhabdus stockiae TaxID=351614 RepID=A0A2D0KN49_9GAMM|nr:TauD/TfdA family dioxygenase [Xenorhabdus stockiae]PHM64864.1 taurine catabolism dioxygenase TauD, TfdA family protein [Xenorhabdus stockiae]
MKPLYIFTEKEKQQIENIIKTNPYNPYTQYSEFKDYISHIIRNHPLPENLVEVCRIIVDDRIKNGNHVHVLKNCPIDLKLPNLDLNNPVQHKYKSKLTYIGEGFLELISQIQKTPLFSYKSRNNGDYFTDLVSFNKFKGKKTGFTDGDLIYHSDRSYHPVRADYVSLLGLQVTESELIYTTYMDVKELKKYLSKEAISMLEKEIFQTDVDDRSKENNSSWQSSATHAIFLKENLIRYQDTFTRPIDQDNIDAIKAILELKHAMSRSEKLRHMIKKGDLLIFGNQTGIHNREWIDVKNPEEGRKRWLLKTYSLDNEEKVQQYSKWATKQDPYCITDN